MTVFDPDLELGRPGADARPHLLVTTRSVTRVPLGPLRLQSVRYRPEMPAVKHVGLFGSLWWRRGAQCNGFVDVLFTDVDATICETATANIGLLDGEEIIWPQADRLAGVTMGLIEAARHPHTRTTAVTLEQLADADAVFATNAAVGIRPIEVIGGVPFPTGRPGLEALCEQYADIPPEPL